MLFGVIFSSFDAEQYGARILEIGQKLRKLCTFKESQCKIFWSSVIALCTWLNIQNAFVQLTCSCAFTASALARTSL